MPFLILATEILLSYAHSKHIAGMISWIQKLLHRNQKGGWHLCAKLHIPHHHHLTLNEFSGKEEINLNVPDLAKEY